MQLTPNFHSSEFFVSDSNPHLVDSYDKVSESVRFNIRLLANRLQVLRDIYGPIKITSGYRGEALNQAVRGSSTSRHKLGMAADIVPLSAGALQRMAKDLKRWQGGFHYYPGDGFIHVDIGSFDRW